MNSPMKREDPTARDSRRRFVRALHVWVGLITALPILAWASSGLLYAWPGAIEGGRVELIDAARIRLTPNEALDRANSFAGRKLPITALTLLVREGRPTYQAIGGMGADSLLIDAETGEVRPTPPPDLLTRYFRQAHFYFFAGRWQIPLLISLSLLSCLSALTGIYLRLALWKGSGAQPARASHDG
ncbi:MAG: PepSY domain-containing protein [Pyrinomonas methylaliphatogenes]|nr:PepSY domain-containing protein [Pyrinomonas methylaliphatogenes]